MVLQDRVAGQTVKKALSLTQIAMIYIDIYHIV